MNSIDNPNSPHVAEAAPEFDGVRMLSDHANTLTAPVPSAHWFVIGTDDESMRPNIYGGAR